MANWTRRTSCRGWCDWCCFWCCSCLGRTKNAMCLSARSIPKPNPPKPAQTRAKPAANLRQGHAKRILISCAHQTNPFETRTAQTQPETPNPHQICTWPHETSSILAPSPRQARPNPHQTRAKPAPNLRLAHAKRTSFLCLHQPNPPNPALKPACFSGSLKRNIPF